MADPSLDLHPVGWVSSPLTDPGLAPKQGDEGSPEAWITFVPEVASALKDLSPGHVVVVLTWLHRANRETLVVRPRGDPNRAETGVFSTRSPDRPNPIGLHRVRILAIDPGGLRYRVADLEALDGTPVLDVKPVLRGVEER